MPTILLGMLGLRSSSWQHLVAAKREPDVSDTPALCWMVNYVVKGERLDNAA
jgi:hypothetical protein